MPVEDESPTVRRGLQLWADQTCQQVRAWICGFFPHLETLRSGPWAWIRAFYLATSCPARFANNSLVAMLIDSTSSPEL